MLAIADIFEALIASRPYRAGMPPEEVNGIVAGDAGTKACAESDAGLLAWLDRRESASRVEVQLGALDRLTAELWPPGARNLRASTTVKL